jgi:hypothetical protein
VDPTPSWVSNVQAKKGQREKEGREKEEKPIAD